MAEMEAELEEVWTEAVLREGSGASRQVQVQVQVQFQVWRSTC